MIQVRVCTNSPAASDSEAKEAPMADPNCWSRTFGTQRGARVRAYERVPGGVLQISVWLPGLGESRRSLGHRDRERAIREARALTKLRHTGAESPEDRRSGALTLGVLFVRYITEGKYLADGSLKTDPYLRHIAAAGQNLATHFGEDLH